VSNFYRPLQELSYMVDYFLWGYDAMGFHLTNLLLHAACAVLVYTILLRILGDLRPALIGGALFGAHPINTEAVSYIAGRADSLFLMFFLLSFLLFIKALESLKDGRGDIKALSIYSVMAYAAAVLSKEIALILPLFLFLYQRTFVDDKQLKVKPQRLYMPYICVFAVYAFLRKTVLDFSAMAPSNILARFDIYQRMVTTCKAFVVYLKLLVLPLGLHMERTVKVSESLMEPSAFGSALILGVICFYIWKARKYSKKIFFFSIWFFLGLIPVSNIIPINSFIAEHWLYLPAVGLFAVAGIGLSRLSEIKGRGILPKLISVIVSAMLIGSYSYLTIQRNKDWKDEVTFFKSTLKYRPDNARLHLNFGNTYSETGMHFEAIEEYKKAIELRPDFATAYGNIGSVYIDLGRYELAVEYIEKALDIKPDYPDALYNLGIIYEDTDVNKAEEYFKRALQLRPDYLNCHTALGFLYMRQGRIREAKRHWKEALRINPREKKSAEMLRVYSR
jgi:Tfp pilus assembly protein PilF